jgi:molybdopterin-containing oxidoreductase family iron-sulfur binding subunit
LHGLNRRDFLKALGITSGASALSACGLDDNRYMTPIESILPYVVKPEQVTTGTPTFFATTITRGPHAQSVAARYRDGRVIFVSANFQGPTSPSVSPASMFELQKHYSPDRIQGPTDSAGGGSTDWDTARGKLVDQFKAAKGAGKKVVYLGGYKSGAIVDLLDDFTDGNAIFWEPAGYEAEVTAAETLFGRREVPYYALDKAKYVLSFGAPFLSGWGDADTEGRYAQGRDPNNGHFVTRLAVVSPLRDQTGANADDFFGCKPGSEATVARAIAGLVAKRKGASAAVTSLIGNVSAADAAAASGLSEAQITAIAEQFASTEAVAIPGGVTGTTDLAAATYLLNLAGGAGGTLFTLGGYRGPVHGIDAIAQLKADLDAGKVGVLMLDDANPVYALPAELGFADAARKADFVVSLSSHPSESSALASMVLPTSDTFEDWGDEEPVAGLRLMRQPSMSALYNTVSLGDLLLTVARAAALTAAGNAAVAAPAAPEGEAVEGEEAAPAPAAPAPRTPGFEPTTWRDYVASVWRGYASGDPVDFWETSVVNGFARTDAGDIAPRLTARSYAFADAPETGSGDLHLHLSTHPFLQDGRYANQPWAQEVPHPITGIVWGSWVAISQATADKLGVTTHDQLSIQVPGMQDPMKVSAWIRRGVADDVLALPLGNGHTASGRYAEYGVNGFAAATAAKDSKGAHYLGGIKVTATKDGRERLVTAFSEKGTSDEGRHFGLHVDADRLAKQGDEEVHHPGELTGVHHLELDERLQEIGVSDFYGLPNHPTYRFGLNVDVNACTGCGACSIACYAENNLPVVGPLMVSQGREMGWIRINRYWETDVGGEDDIRFVPMMCQHCGHAGCENVCPVLATYHNLDGLNAMVYNRCVGTRYCSNACPFSARRFNYHTYTWPEPFNLQLNPDVSTREMGVMEKCTFCVQRLRQTKSAYKDGGNFTRTVPHEVWEQVPACAEACPSQALTFGNLNDAESKVAKAKKSGRFYQPLADLNVFSAVNYLAKANFHDDPMSHHGGGHGGGHGEHADGHGDDHGDAHHDDAKSHGKAEAHGDDHHGGDAHDEPKAHGEAGGHGDGH